MKNPLLKLIEVADKLGNCEEAMPCVNGIVDYLNRCKCCAFCKNYGFHDDCPESHEYDFNVFEWCDYFCDKREEDKYKPPNGNALEFYADVASSLKSQSMMEKNIAELLKLGFKEEDIGDGTKADAKLVKEIPAFNGIVFKVVVLLNRKTFKPDGENVADVWIGGEYIGHKDGSSVITPAASPVRELLDRVGRVVNRGMKDLMSKFQKGLNIDKDKQ